MLPQCKCCGRRKPLIRSGWCKECSAAVPWSWRGCRPASDVHREARLAYYEQRAAARLPLFPPPISLM